MTSDQGPFVHSGTLSPPPTPLLAPLLLGLLSHLRLQNSQQMPCAQFPWPPTDAEGASEKSRKLCPVLCESGASTEGPNPRGTTLFTQLKGQRPAFHMHYTSDSRQGPPSGLVCLLSIRIRGISPPQVLQLSVSLSCVQDNVSISWD